MFRSVFASVCLCVILSPSVAMGQTDLATANHVLYLHDGTVLPGRILEETEDSIVLEHASLGRLVVA
jgi:hypothetical protein